MSTEALPQPSLQQVVDRILSSRRITRLDQHLLLSFRNLNLEEQSLINQVFERLQRGLLRVTD